MRSAVVTLLVAAALAAPPVAIAQDEPLSQAGTLPSSLFEPAPDGVPGRPLPDDSGTPVLLAAVLVAGAAVAGYFTGSSRRTRRS